AGRRLPAPPRLPRHPQPVRGHLPRRAAGVPGRPVRAGVAEDPRGHRARRQQRRTDHRRPGPAGRGARPAVRLDPADARRRRRGGPEAPRRGARAQRRGRDRADAPPRPRPGAHRAVRAGHHRPVRTRRARPAGPPAGPPVPAAPLRPAQPRRRPGRPVPGERRRRRGHRRHDRRPRHRLRRGVAEGLTRPAAPPGPPPRGPGRRRPHRTLAPASAPPARRPPKAPPAYPKSTPHSTPPAVPRGERRKGPTVSTARRSRAVPLAGAALASACAALLAAGAAPAEAGVRPAPSPGCGSAPPQAPGESRQHDLTTADGTDRSYRLHLPDDYSPDTPAPLLLAYHGRGGTGAGTEEFSKLSELPAAVVYPEGLVGTGDGERQAWQGAPYSPPGTDDVAFTHDLLDELEAGLCIDRGRVYATGKSNGAGFTAILACAASERITAIAPVAGAFYPDGPGCSPTRQIPVIEFHGTA